MPPSLSLALLVESVATWNQRIAELVPPTQKGATVADLRGADFGVRRHDGKPLDLTGVDLRHVDLRGAMFRAAPQSGDPLSLAHARLSHALLWGATFHGVDLHGASLRESKLQGAMFDQDCNLRHANLTGADVAGAVFDGCQAYGAALWATKGQPKSVRLRLSREKERAGRGHVVRALEADDLGTASFLYLIEDNGRITTALAHLSEKLVLLIGRFADESQKGRLKAMKRALRKSGKLVPVVFDFAVPAQRSLTETLGALAHLSSFVIADLEDARSVPQELSHIVPFLPSVPVVPLVRKPGTAYAMFEHWLRYPWVLDEVAYGDDFELFMKTRFEADVIGRAEAARSALKAKMQRAAQTS